jgi:hypothetical protein
MFSSIPTIKGANAFGEQFLTCRYCGLSLGRVAVDDVLRVESHAVICRKYRQYSARVVLGNTLKKLRAV